MASNDWSSPRKSGARDLSGSRDVMQEYLAKELTRRGLLQGALASAALVGCGSDNGAITTQPGADASTGADAAADVTTDAAADVTPDAPPKRTPHLVGMGKHDDHVMAAELALQETHGFDFIQRGQRVYLKVNTNSGDPFPYSTSPDMIRWVVGKIRDRGGEVLIGDRSFWGDSNTMRNFEGNGIADVARELGVDLMVFGDRATLATGARADSTQVDWIDLPTTVDGMGARSAVWDGTMRIPMPVAMADHIIAMPCVKTHFIATFTMSLKNFIGLINPVDRSRSMNLGNHDGRTGGRLFRQVAYMNKAGPTASLVVLDGHQALISGGPTPNDRPPRAPAGFTPQIGEPHAVIISRDRVAADITGAALLRTLSPTYEYIRDGILWNNRQLSVAIAAGIGLTSRDAYDLSGPSVDNLDAIRAQVVAT